MPGGRWLLPLLAPLTLWPAFAPAIRARRYHAAFLQGMLWAALLSVGVVLLVRFAPAAARDGILHGEAYRAEMFGWIETGLAPENDWRAFLPQHLLHLAAFALLAWLSGGYLGLVLGAGLMDYMSYFVGSFAVASGAPVAGALVAWVPWSVVRVASFVALGGVLARPRLAGERLAIGPEELPWLLAASCGILVDLAVKALCAPAYGLFLRGLLVD